MTEKNIETLTAERDAAAEQARQAARAARSAEEARNRDIQAAKQIVHTRHEAALSLAYAVKDKAVKELQAANDALAQAKKSSYPVGAVYLGWKQDGHRWGRYQGPLYLTGKRAVLGVWSSGEPRPGNKSYGFPDVGEPFLRLLKKDGTESLQFECVDRGYGASAGALCFDYSGYYPEGVDPNIERAKRKAAASDEG